MRSFRSKQYVIDLNKAGEMDSQLYRKKFGAYSQMAQYQIQRGSQRRLRKGLAMNGDSGSAVEIHDEGY
jgi:hypothetical protein